MSREQPRSRGARAAKALVVLFVLGFVVAQAAAWWWTRERLPGLLNRNPERLIVTWSSLSYDFVRGVRVKGLQLRGQTPRVQWELLVDGARCDIGLFALQRKRLRFEDMEAHGVTLRLRGFAEPGEPAQDGAPPIEDALEPIAENAPARRSPPSKRWTYEFDDCAAHDVKEIWIGSWRVRDIASVRVDHVASRVRELLEIEGAAVETRAATLTRRNARLADEIAVNTEFSILGYDRASAPPREMLDHATGRVAGTARLRELELDNAHFPNLPWLAFGGARGRLEMDVGVDRGRLVDGSRLALVADDLVAAALGYRVTGGASVTAVVTSQDGGTGSLTATLDGFRVARGGSARPLAEGTGLIARVATRDLRLLDLLRTYEVELDLPQTRVLDVAELGPLIPDTVPVSLRGGSGTLLASLRATDTTSSGMARLDLVDLDIAAGDLALRGAAVIDAIFPSVQPELLRFDLTGTTVRLRDVALRDESVAAGKGWSADMEIVRGVLEAKDAVSFAGDLRVRLDDMRPVLALVSATRGLPPLAGTLLQGRNVDVRMGLVTAPGAIEVRDAVLEAEGLEARACLRLRGPDRVGYFWFDSGLISAGMQFRPDGARGRFMAGREWLEAHRADCE